MLGRRGEILRKFALVCYATVLLSGEILALTWPEAVARAALVSNDIKSAQKQLESSRWSYYKAYGSFLPQVSANMSGGTSASTPQSFAYGLSASLPLFKGLANYFNLQSANLNYQSDAAGLKAAEASAYYSLRSAFIDLLSAQENSKVQEKILASRRQNSKMVKLLYEGGTEDKGNYLKTQTQVFEAEYNLSAAKRTLELAGFRLAQLLEVEVTSVEGGAVGALENSADYKSLMLNTPAYQQAKFQLDLADLNQKATLSEFLPSISLSASYSRSDTIWPPANSSKSLSLSLSYPLFPGGTNIADRFIYGARLDQAREDFAKSEKDLLFDIRDAYISYKNALESNAVQQSYLQASLERAKIAQVKYLNGLISYNEWDQIQNEYVSYQKSIITSNKARWLAAANWHKSYGGWVK